MKYNSPYKLFNGEKIVWVIILEPAIDTFMNLQ